MAGTVRINRERARVRTGGRERSAVVRRSLMARRASWFGGTRRADRTVRPMTGGRLIGSSRRSGDAGEEVLDGAIHDLVTQMRSGECTTIGCHTVPLV